MMSASSFSNFPRSALEASNYHVSTKEVTERKKVYLTVSPLDESACKSIAHISARLFRSRSANKRCSKASEIRVRAVEFASTAPQLEQCKTQEQRGRTGLEAIAKYSHEDNPGLFVICATYARRRNRQESRQYKGRVLIK